MATTTSTENGAAVTAAADMTDWRSVQLFQMRCGRSLDRRPQRLVLDLTDVRFADTKLIACMVNIVCRAHRHGIQVEVKPSAPVRDVICLCRLGGVLGPPMAQ